MFQTLYARLSIALIGLFLTTGLLYILISSAVTEHYLQEITQHFNRDLAQRIVLDRGLVIDGEMNDQALKATFSAYMDINPSIEIYLLDKSGKILAYSADPGHVKRERVGLAPIKAFLRGEGFPLLGDDPRSHERRKAFSVTQVPAGDMPSGYLYVVLRGEQYDSAEHAVEESYVFKLSASAVVFSLGFGLLTGLLLFHWLTRRLQRLSAVMSLFQQSDFTQHEPFMPRHSVRKGDEVDRLGTAFDEMASRIIDQWGQLKEQDRLRRELVAQVSHDLRTPLAVLHGYLETLDMKHSELQPADQQEYVSTALRQSERLRRMVGELFELAQLEARETQPVCEPMVIAELVQDVVQKFQLRAAQEGISLLYDPPKVSFFVMADFALCERILNNLISNAFDHVAPGGDIWLEVVPTAEQWIRISVHDNGVGIAPEDLSHLFDPFYRGVRAIGRSGHAGLGLAIAKRMVELQSGEISAGNHPAGGACFSFTLPIADIE
jgi:signal transduction histidine kinase